MRQSTLDGYRDKLERHVYPNLGDRKLSKLAVSDVQALIREKAETLSPLSVKHVRDVLRNVLAQAEREGYLERNVAALARVPRQERSERGYLTREEAKRYLEALEGHRLRPLFILALATGLRRGEIVALKWEDVDLEEGTLAVRRTITRSSEGLVESEPKTERSRRTIAIPGFALKALKEHRANQLEERMRAANLWVDSGRVFVQENGRGYAPSTITRLAKKFACKAGRPDLRFHDLRHSAASFMLAAGVPLRVVMESLGHSTIGITADLYGHIAPEIQRAAADAVDDVFSGQ